MTDAEKNALSSLGTTYAKSDFSNVGTKSLGQNGYYKFPDGLMIQWGKRRVALTLEQYISPLHSMTQIILCT